MAKNEAPEHEITEPGSHVATHRGYAAGTIIEPGEPVPAGIAVAEEWMAPATITESASEAETPTE